MSPFTPIRTWHICISGFTQREGQLTGLQRIWQRLTGLYNTPDSIVTLRQWNAPWDKLAELIWLTAQQGETDPCVNIYAYSWGGGWGFTQLSRALEQRGIKVCTAVLCDPVYCARLWSFRWLAKVNGMKIRVPGNVREVWWSYQRNNWPRAHKVIKTRSNQNTIIHDGIRVSGLTHHYMDESPVFFQQVMEAARMMAAGHEHTPLTQGLEK